MLTQRLGIELHDLAAFDGQQVGDFLGIPLVPHAGQARDTSKIPHVQQAITELRRRLCASLEHLSADQQGIVGLRG